MLVSLSFSEVSIEAVDPRWSNGFGLGLGFHPSLSNSLEADLGGFYEDRDAGKEGMRVHSSLLLLRISTVYGILLWLNCVSNI